jgi:hypothetical protein
MQVILDEPAGVRAVIAEVDRNVVIDDDRNESAQHTGRMRPAGIAPLRDVGHARLKHHAGAPVGFEAQQFLAKSFAVPDDGLNEVGQRLAFDREFGFPSLNRVIARGQRPADGRYPLGRKRVRLLFSRIDDDRDGPVHGAPSFK